METWSVHSLYSQAKESLGQESAESLQKYAAGLRANGLPVIFSLGHLAHIVGADCDVLKQTVLRNRERANYRMYRITKRSGGHRYIHSVNGKLLEIQRFINEFILQKTVVHPASMAYRSGSGGIRKCALAHCRCRWLFQFDLKDFFWDVSEVDAFHVFNNLGYRRLLSFELARICTTIHLPVVAHSKIYHVARRHRLPPYEDPILPYGRSNCSGVGVLPMGAPTSPMLSNLTAYKLDCALAQIAESHRMVYTRYADDLCFSLNRDPNNSEISTIRSSIVSAIRANKFMVNDKKTRIARPGSTKEVAGLLVDGDVPRIPRHTRGRIDRLLYAIEKYGIDAVARNDGFDTTVGLYNHLCGLVAYASDVDPALGLLISERLRSLRMPLEDKPAEW